jgi:hypothetical protein
MIARLFQVRADNLDHVVHRFDRRLRGPRHVVPDVILEKFLYQAIDRSASRGQPLQNIRARRILVESSFDRFELSDNFFCSVQKIELIPGCVRHGL